VPLPLALATWYSCKTVPTNVQLPAEDDDRLKTQPVLSLESDEPDVLTEEAREEEVRKIHLRMVALGLRRATLNRRRAKQRAGERKI